MNAETATTAALEFTDYTQDGVGAVLGEQFLYAMTHVIKFKALPQLPDGLLPSQRRQIMALQDNKAFHDRPHIKARKIVGDTMSNYHPAGDNYDVLVNQTQKYRVQLPLTDGEGNWGPIESGKAAPDRYTEIRLSKAAEAILLEDLPSARSSGDDAPHGIVPQHPTYTGLLLEEDHFPARVPLILINGASAIAIAIMQSWLQLNAREALGQFVNFLTTGVFDIDAVGLGYPTQPTVVSTRAEVTEALRTGRGSVRVAATWQAEGDSIVFTSVPPTTYLNDIGDAANQWLNTPTGSGVITDYNNESGEDNSIRLVFKLAKGMTPAEAAPIIMRHCKLTDTITVQQYVLHNNRPVRLGLIEYLTMWTDERQAQIQRIAGRDVARLSTDLRRLNITAWLRDNMTEAEYPADPVIRILRTAENPESILARLNGIPGADQFALDLSDVTRILDSNIRSISRLSDEDLFKRRARLTADLEAATLLHENRQPRINLIVKQTQDILKLLDSDCIRTRDEHHPLPDYKCPFGGASYTEIAAGTLAKARPKAETLRETIEAQDDREVLITTEQGFILRLSTRSIGADPKRPAALNAGDRITQATFHNRANLVIIDDKGVISVVKRSALKIGEQVRYTVLNNTLGTKISGRPVVLTPNNDPAEKMVVRYGSIIKVMDLETEVYSPRALIKAPGTITDATTAKDKIIVTNGPNKPLAVSIAKLSNVSRSRTGRLPTIKYTGRSALIVDRQMINTDGVNVWRETY